MTLARTSRVAVGAVLTACAVLAAPSVALAGPLGGSPTPTPSCLKRTSQIYVSDNSAYGANNGGITAVDAPTGTRSVLSENNSPVGSPEFETPWGMTKDANGDLLVAEQSIVVGAAVPSIIRVDRATGTRTLISSNASPAGGPQFGTPSGIALDAGGDIIVADMTAFTDGAILRVNPTTGARTVISRNSAPAGGPRLDGPMDLAIAANGDIYVANTFGTNVIRVNPTTGARTLISANGNPGGGNAFSWPWGMTLDVNGDILIADSNAYGGPGGIIRVDPATGTRTVVSNNANGSGPIFDHPGDLVVESCTNTLLVTDSGMEAVYRVDPATGNRTLISDNTSPGSISFVWPQGIVTADTLLIPPPVVPTK